MVAVFRDITMTWDGVDYVITPSLRLLRRIESSDVSMADLAVRTSQGRPPIGQFSLVIGTMLRAGGADVTDDDVYSALLSSDTDMITEWITAVLTAFSPSDGVDQKKADARPSSTPSVRKRRSPGNQK